MKYGDLTLGQTEALVNKLGGKEVVDGILSGKLAVTVTKVVSRILDFIGTVKVAVTGKFFVSDHFTTGIKAVKIAWIGDNFKQWFSSKVEEPQAEATLRIHKLNKSSLDAPILVELGDKAETTLQSIWELLKKQPSGESGTLLTNSYANIFYVRDAKGTLQVVVVCWGGGCWGVYASSVADPRGWGDGSRVFSRNS